MNPFHKFAAKVLAGLSIVVLAVAEPSQAAVDADAKIVHLRKSCLENAVEIANCFTGPGALVGWMGTASTSGNLVIKVGPGAFGFFDPRGTGKNNFSVQGSGPAQTSFTGMSFQDQFGVHVQDLTVNNWFPAPVYWFGKGSSTWVNVHLNGALYAWTETGCSGVLTNADRPKHYWFSSKITSSGTGYLASCSENWFFGTEITAKGPGHANALWAFNMYSYAGTGVVPEVHVYGGVIRAIGIPGVIYPSGVIAASVSGGGMFHAHGTGIDVISPEANTVTALAAASNAEIHASGVGYVLETAAGGTARRISNNGGHVHAPYLWEHIPDPATAPNFTSANGADQTTVTVGTSDGHPHTAVYSSTCPANARWYDQVDKVCRGQ